MDLMPKKYYLGNAFDDYFLFSNNFLKSDIYEKDNNYIVEIDVPGINKKDIEISYQNGYLIVGIKKLIQAEEENRKYIRRERGQGEYYRQFYLDNVDITKIKAKFEEGLLIITIPKQDDDEDKKVIEIK